MNKKKHNIFGWGFLKDFFHFKPNTWIVGASIVLLSGIFLYFFTIPAIHFFPSDKDFQVIFFNDNGNGGNSEIVKQSVSDRIIDFEFELKEGFLSPYVGLSIAPLKQSVINLSRYNQIRLKIAGQKIAGIGVSIYTKNPNTAAQSNELCFITNLGISPKYKQYDISLDQLKISDWWRDLNRISSKESTHPDLKNVLRLNINTAYTPVLGTRSSLTIEEISVERNNTNLILLLISAEFIVFLLLIIIHYLRAKLRKANEPITITYKPVETENQNLQFTGFLDYLNSHFHENDLTLEQVSSHTGINERRIATTIQENFGCNFKSYINQLRINESKRLLKETDFNMGEIAFKVGFNNQSHFNRVFKSLVRISPSEFKAQ